MSKPSQALFRTLPGVDELLRQPALAALLAAQGRSALVEAARQELEALRARIAAGGLAEAELAEAVAALPAALALRLRAQTAFSLRRVINAGGVLIHTNLGRAPLSRAAVERIAHTACGYCNLEYELDEGRRGSRDQHAQRLFATLFERQDLPGTATLVVNNNAAAVLLALAALARAGQVIVSRGELVEIGGSFRIPEIMEQSGALLREVGSTNRTRVADYEQAIGESTRLLLRVHRSNFEMIGFTEQPSLAELVELGARRGLPVMEDLGSGSLVKMAAFGIPDEPSVADSLRAGAALVTYSGDKLLGGPQAGLITGRPELVARLRSHPLFRALRVDKLTYAALEATLVSYLREAYDELPLLRMMRLTPASIRARCEALAAAVGAVEADGSSAAPRLHVEVVATECMIGGGSAPGRSLPSHAVALTAAGIGAAELLRRLRLREQPINARVEDDRVLLDLRTVEPDDDARLAEAIAEAVAHSSPPLD